MNVPVPHDIPLALPAAEWFLKTLLVLAFIAHIFFVNLMVGGSILTLIYEIKGMKNPYYDRVACKIAKTITVNKSMAVVLGVAPLLLINVLYTVWFYAANAMTGTAWIMVVPSVTVAFILTYLHQYTWDQMQTRKKLHIVIMACAVFIFLCIPFIFLTNINLMLFPTKWHLIKGFFSAMMLPNIFPRYLHFLTACMAVSGLFLVWFFRSEKHVGEDFYQGESKAELLREFYSIALYLSMLQFIVGPTVLLTLPAEGLHLRLYVLIFTGVIFALFSIRLMSKELNAPDEKVGSNVFPIAGLLFITVIFMASGRHFYREHALAEHRALVEDKTKAYQQKAEEARKEKQ